VENRVRSSDQSFIDRKDFPIAGVDFLLDDFLFGINHIEGNTIEIAISIFKFCLELPHPKRPARAALRASSNVSFAEARAVLFS